MALQIRSAQDAGGMAVMRLVHKITEAAAFGLVGPRSIFHQFVQ
jgi:hypothetical protein